MKTTNPYESSVLPAQELPPIYGATATRWRVVAMCIAMAVLLYLDRFAMNAVLPVIRESLQLTQEHMGWITSAFFWAYALAQVPAGMLGDRLGGRRTLSMYVALWSVAFGAQAFANSFEVFCVLRVLQGIAQAGAYAVTAVFLKDWIEHERRGFANSSVSMGGRVGGALSNVITPSLVAIVGVVLFRLHVVDEEGAMPWRPVFVAYAVLGLVWAAIFYRWFRDTPEQHGQVNAAELAIIRSGASKAVVHLAPPPPVWTVLANRNLWLLSIIMCLVNVGWIFLATFQVTYWTEVYQFSAVKAGTLTAIAAVGGIMGCVCGGFATDFLVARVGLTWGRRLPGLIACAGAASMYLLSLSVNSWVAMAFAFTSVYFLNDFLLGALWSAVQDVGRRNSGSMFGFINMSGNLGAAAFAPVIGKLADADRWSSVFAASAVVMLIASVLWFLVNPRITLPERGAA